MSAVAVLAVGWIAQIGSTVINGLEELGFDMDVKEADKTTFQSGGNEEHYVALRGRTLKLSGLYLEDNSGNQDAGQAAVEALGAFVGPASLGAFTLTSPNGRVRTFSASVKMDSTGGNKAENTKWGATLKVSGAVTG
jgi:hypothetical protein